MLLCRKTRLLYLRWVVGNHTLKVWQLLDVFIAEPLDFEVQVHVVGALTQSVLLVLCGCKYRKSGETWELP